MEFIGILLFAGLGVAELVGFFKDDEEFAGALLFGRPIVVFVAALLCGGSFWTALLYGAGWGFLGFVLSMLVSENKPSKAPTAPKEPSPPTPPAPEPPRSAPAPAPASDDKGYTTIRLKKAGEVWQLQDMNLYANEGEEDFYIDYEDGTIFLDWHDGKPREVIGYYQQQPDSSGLVSVYDSTRQRIIGRVGSELIFFRKREADPAAGRCSPEETCLAYYTKNGSITTLKALPYVGRFNGSEPGGAAAFVAIFYSYRFESIYRDYFLLETETFREKHRNYFPL